MTIEKCISSTTEALIWIFLSNLFNILLKNSFKGFTVFSEGSERRKIWDTNDESPREAKIEREKNPNRLEKLPFQIPQEHYSEVWDLLLKPMQQFCQKSSSQFSYLPCFFLHITRWCCEVSSSHRKGVPQWRNFFLMFKVFSYFFQYELYTIERALERKLCFELEVK